mgnify:CR=1 FL=1
MWTACSLVYQNGPTIMVTYLGNELKVSSSNPYVPLSQPFLQPSCFAQIYELMNKGTIQLPIVFKQYHEENQKLDTIPYLSIFINPSI